MFKKPNIYRFFRAVSVYAYTVYVEFSNMASDLLLCKLPQQSWALPVAFSSKHDTFYSIKARI